MLALPTKLRDESAEETKLKGDHKETKNEKQEFTSTEEPGDTVVSTLAGVLASHIRPLAA
jgi:hypothetical protein